MSLPGGDDFGNRPIDIHLHGLLDAGGGVPDGARQHRGPRARWADGRLVGQRVVFEYPSHTATDNVLMAAVLAKGTTVIENAAREPEVSDLADFLTHMGAAHPGGRHVAHRGRRRRRAAPRGRGHIASSPTGWWRPPCCRRSAMAGGDIVIEDGRPDHMDMVLRKMGEIGVTVTQRPEGMRADGDRAAPQRRRGHPSRTPGWPPTTSRSW